MNEPHLKNMTLNDIDNFSSRRKFLKKLACGSLLAIGSTGVAGAAARHLAQSSNHKDKHSTQVANKPKDKHSVKVTSQHSDKHSVKVANSHNDKHLVKMTHQHSDKQSFKVAHKHLEIHEHVRHHEVITAKNNNFFSHNQRIIHNSQEDVIHTTENEIFRPRQYETIHRSFLSDARTPSHKTLELQNMNTGEKLKLTYFEQGEYLQESLKEISHLFRDHHTDEVHSVDAALLDQLYDLQISLGINKPYSLVCGYRSPATNGMMHFLSRGVAKHSLHMEGRAADIRIEGVSTRDIKEAALAMGRGGVGYYPSNNFVHVDTGAVRTW